MSYLAHILPWADRPAHVPESPTLPAAAKKLWGTLRSVWQRVSDAKGVRGGERRLRIVERVVLGDRQFVALLELDGTTYLASGGHGVPLHIIAAQSSSATKTTARAASPQAPTPISVGQSASGKPRRTRLKAAAPAQDSAAHQADAEPTTGRTAAAATVKHLSCEAFGKTAPGETDVRSAARPKRERKVPAAQSGLCTRCAASLSSEAAAKAVAPPLPEPPKTVGKQPKVLTKARSGTVSTERRESVPQRALPVSFDKVPVVSENETTPEPAPSASTAFAALLELRMLASQVFEELEASPGLENAAAAPVAVTSAAPKSGKALDVVHEQKEPSRVLTRLHRLRGRLSAYACLLVLLFAPHGVASGQTPPGFSPFRHHAASVARGSPFELDAVSLNMLAEAPLPNGDIHITGLGGSSASWSIVVLLTLLTLIPALLLCITPFARLLIVFHFLRQALGLQTTPSNQTLIGLSLILTFFLMQPTGEVIYRDAIVPAQAGKLTPLDAVVRAGDPMRHFMAHYVREKDAELFLEIAKEPRPRTVEDMSFRVLLPSYILSELKAGFQIGTVLFLPFLIVDMVVASITTSVGMMQLPPVVISTPLKLLLFLMVDGWHLLIGALMRSFN